MLTALLCVLGVAYVGVAGAVHARLKGRHKMDHLPALLLASAWPAALAYSVGYGRVNDRFLVAEAAEEEAQRALADMELEERHLMAERTPSGDVSSNFAVVCECGHRRDYYNRGSAVLEWQDHNLSCSFTTRLWTNSDPE